MMICLFTLVSVSPITVFATDEYDNEQSEESIKLDGWTDKEIRSEYSHYICEYVFILYKNTSNSLVPSTRTYSVEWENGVIVNCVNHDDNGKEDTFFDIRFADEDEDNKFLGFTTDIVGKGTRCYGYKTDCDASWTSKAFFSKVGQDTVIGKRFITLFAQWEEGTPSIATSVPLKISEIVAENYHLYVTKAWDWFYQWIGQIYGKGITDGLENILVIETEPSKSKTFTGSVWAMATSIYDVLIPISYVLIILYTLIEMTTLLSRQKMNAEHLFKIFIKFIIMASIISFMPDIISILIEFSNALLRSFSVSSANVEILRSWAGKLDEDPSFITKVKYLGEIIVYYLVYLAARYVVLGILISRVIEVGVRTAFIPLAVPDITTKGIHSNGYMYIKKLAAACIYGPVVAMICVLFNLIPAIDGMSTFVSRIVLTVVLVTFVKQSRPIVNNILGVH